MNTLPCHGCRGSWTPNCNEDCMSYDVWARAFLRKVYDALLKEDLVQAAEHHFIADSETYYEPCDESGEPYQKGSLDDKFKKFRE